MKIPRPNVQKVDVCYMDLVRHAIQNGVRRVSLHVRTIKFNIWSGAVEASEVTTTVEHDHDVRG